MIEVLAHIQQPTDILQLVVTVGTIVIAIASMLFAGYGNFLQKRHNIKSVMPILNILAEVTDSRMYIILVNNGVGPAIINELVWKNRISSNSSLYDMINSTFATSGFIFTTCAIGINKRALSPQRNIILFDYMEREDRNFIREKEKMLEFISNLNLFVSYTDIYNSKFEKIDYTFDNFLHS